jgi:hypothetical protein
MFSIKDPATRFLLGVFCIGGIVLAVIALDRSVIANRYLSSQAVLESALNRGLVIPTSSCSAGVLHAAGDLCVLGITECGEAFESYLVEVVKICRQERRRREKTARQEKLEQNLSNYHQKETLSGERPLPEGG